MLVLVGVGLGVIDGVAFGAGVFGVGACVVVGGGGVGVDVGVGAVVCDGGVRRCSNSAV